MEAQFTLPAKRIRHVLIGVIICLVLLGFASVVAEDVFDTRRFRTLAYLFNMVRECNIPNWYASMLLFSCSILLAVTAAMVPVGKGSYRRHWIALSLMFLYISIDETAQIHELVNSPLRKALGVDGIFHYAWVIPATVIVIILAISYFGFLRALSVRIRRLMVLSALLYVGGALGTEFYINHWVTLYGTDPVYGLLNIVQETMELSGISVFFMALLYVHQERTGEIRMKIA